MAISVHTNSWILGPKRDLLFFILPPLIILPFFLVLSKRWAPEVLALYVLGLGGFGHHLPGFIRVYADRGLFHRFKYRFTVIPLFLIAICGVYSFLNLNALAFLTVAWGTWHGAMQVNGFMRIYDSKVKSIHPWTAELDWLMCIGWFGLAIVHSSDKMFSLAALFYGSGGFLIPVWGFTALYWGFNFFTATVTLLYLWNWRRQAKAGQPPSFQKILTMIVSFAFWWFCVVSLHNLVLGVLMAEIFHDLQYNVLVWMFQRHRVDKNQTAGWMERLFFKPGRWPLLLYMSLILVYGIVGVITSFSGVQLPDLSSVSGFSALLMRVTLASALLHFYYDGFIWRMRDETVRRELEILEANKKNPEKPKLEANGLASYWKWLLFIVPAAYMGVNQYRGGTPDFGDQMENLAMALPDNFKANFMAGTRFKAEGDLASAEHHYRLAIEANPDFAMGHLFLGDILFKLQRFDEATVQYRLAVDLDPTNLEGRINLANLYLRTNRPSLAESQFKEVLAAEPQNPDLNYSTATALLQQNKLGEAVPYIEEALRANPNHSGALNYYGMVKDLQGDKQTAVEYYRRSLAVDSTNASARENLDALTNK